MDRFQIFLRRRQNVYSNPETGLTYNVKVQCNPSTGFAEYIPGDIDQTWYEFTNYIEEAEKLSMTWDKVNSGNSSNSQTNKDGSNFDKGITSDLVFFDAAYQFIYDWLLTTECQILNAVEVKIIDLIASAAYPYRVFEIKNDNIEWAPFDEPCRFKIKLREQDYAWHCIHKTFIFDDWQLWFNSKNNSTKEHPCFLTAIEPRPRLVNSVRMGLAIFYHSNPLVNLVSGHLKEDVREILNVDRFVVAPFVRTYIENVAGKCGLSMDTIFDEGQLWDKLCLYYPQAGFMHESDHDNITSPSPYYHYGNRWLITIAELLDKLKPVFAAEWYVTPGNTIVFKYTKDLINLLPIYDFSATGSEPIYNLVYTFNGDKKPAYGRYQYQDDGSDLASQEMSTLYSDIIDYDGPKNNPMLSGEKTKSLEFAPTGFVRDGRVKDYIKLLINDGRAVAFVLLIILEVMALVEAGNLGLGFFILTGYIGFWAGSIPHKIDLLRDEFVDGPIYTGAVRLTSEQTLTPRLILWDGVNMNRAKAKAMLTLPTPNAYYNPLLTPYNKKNKIDTDNPNLVVYNYPLYFDGDFTGNLFDSYHDEIDNPLKSKESHQTAKWNVDLCENMLNLFGVFQDQYAQIGKVVKLEERNNYSIYVRIGNISVDYEANKINLKGTVLRRAA